MKRTVRPSRFQLGDASEEPRPSYRKLCFVNPFQLGAPSALPFASSVPVSICNSSQHKPYVAARPPIVPCAGTVESSARSLEEAARLKWAQAWVACARVVAAHSASLCDISSDSAFLPLFLDRSPSTLQRHLSGWQVWTSYCVLQGWTAAAPSMAQVLDFLESLRAGCTRDRGKERKRSAAAVLRAMFFAAFKLSLPVLSSLLESPLIQAWKDLGKWNMAAVREAIPLPLDLVRKLERAFLEVEGESRVILGAILLMIWGSLRWSEIQRLDLKSVQLCDGMIKGRCVRGMPWACLSSGCCGSDWGSVLMETHTHGRSAYQAVFGRQPRLLNGNFNDPMVLATSPSIAQVDQSAGFRAEFIRCEALKRLHELDCSQHLRRALLRKTRTTKIADLQPGQAYWRWTRRGSKKRGGWVMARFLSWDPSYVGKQAWLRTGASTTLVTAEQLRAAFGFEDWVPDKEDVQAAATKFESFLDDRGPDPPQDQLPEDDELEWPAEQPDAEMPMTPSMAVLAPSTPAEPSSVPQPIPPQQPSTPTLLPLSEQQQLSLSQQQISQQQSVHFNIDSPTNINQMIQQQHHRYGAVPERSRRRSRTPTLKRYGSTAAASNALQQTEQQALPQAEQTAPAEQPALHDVQHPPVEQTAGEEFVETSQTPAPVSTHQEVSQHATALDEQQTERNTGDTQQQQAPTDTQQVVVVPDDDVQQVSSSASSMSTG